MGSVRCRCGLEARLQTVHKEGPNKGRQFYGCPLFPDPGQCKFFEWKKDGLPAGGASPPQQTPPARRRAPQQPPWSSPAGARGGGRVLGGGGAQTPQQQQYSDAEAFLDDVGWQPRQTPRQQQQSQWAGAGRPGGGGQHGQTLQQQGGWGGSPYPPSPAAPAPAGYGAPVGGWAAYGAAAPDVPPDQLGGRAFVYIPRGGAGSPVQGSQRAQGMPASQRSQETPASQPASRQAHAPRASQPEASPTPPQQARRHLPASLLDGGGPLAQQMRQRAAAQQQHWQAASQEQQQQTPGSAGPAVRVSFQALGTDLVGISYPFNKEVNEFIKQYGAWWDCERRVWVCRMCSYDGLLAALQASTPQARGGAAAAAARRCVHCLPALLRACAEIGCTVHATPIPTEALQMAEPGSQGAGAGAAGSAFAVQPVLPEDEVEARLGSLPPELWSRLYPFQQEGVRFGVARGGRCLLADEMGLGKTVQALAIAAAFGPEDWPLLVVCPATMKLVWQDAGMAKLLDGMDPGAAARVLIVSYEMVKKSPITQRTRAVAGLARAMRRMVLVTGTPALSRPIELFPQIDILAPGMFGSINDFGMRYCNGKPAELHFHASPGTGMDYRGSSNLAELQAWLRATLMVRRLKSEVLDQLPDKVRKRVPIEVDPSHRAKLTEVVLELRALEREEQEGAVDFEEAANRRRLLMSEWFRRTGPAKARALRPRRKKPRRPAAAPSPSPAVKEAAAHITGLLEAGHKLLVFAHHKETLDALQYQVFPAVGGGRRCVRIDGQVTPERRKAAVDAFQGDRGVAAALLSITAAGVGLTLTAASAVVFVELWWNYGQLAEDRAHRLGQRQSLQVHYLVAPGTADDSIWRLLRSKNFVVGEAMGDASFDAEEGERLFCAAEVLAAEAAAGGAGGARGARGAAASSEEEEEEQREDAEAGDGEGPEVIDLVSSSEEEESEPEEERPQRKRRRV
eukprot:scaffold2.g6963.t1